MRFLSLIPSSASTVSHRAVLAGRSSLGAEEPQDEPVELLRALDTRHVGGPGDLCLACAGNPGCEPLGDRVHVGDVLAADEYERRDAKLDEAAPQIRHQQLILGVLPDRKLQLERTSLHLGDEAPYGWIDLAGPALRPVDPHAQARLDGTVEIPSLERGL